MDLIKRHGHWILTLFVMFVFIQSLFFKFTNAPETIYIFQGRLDPWAASLGHEGVFAPGGIFSAHVIGSLELIASALLLAGALFSPRVQGLGAGLGLGIMSGAIFFHLCTPLGVQVQDGNGHYDGGLLFALACGVWISCAILVWLRRRALRGPLRPR